MYIIDIEQKDLLSNKTSNFVYNGKLEANIMKFEILCMDNKESVKSKKLESLILAFKANDTL